MTQQIDNRLIAFTGPDGIGKTTQGKMLVDWMNSESIAWIKWFNVVYVKELSDSNHIFGLFRNIIYSLYKQVDVVTLANLIQLNRYVLQKDLVGELKANINKVIVVDRWNICTYCYVKASGVDQVLAASYLTDEHTVIPGLTIMLVGVKGATRTSNRASNNNMFEDVGDDFNVKLAKTYIEFDTSLYNGKVVKINNDELTKEETHELIKQAVLDYFRGNL
jgi:thymidylate kinase